MDNEDNSSDDVIKRRKDNLFRVLKKKSTLIVYAILAFIIFLAVRIRTRNLGELRDVTTGGWTLGPDLDPFLFLRWAKYIVEHGSLFVNDMMRYVPIGYDTRTDLLLHPYMIAWFHKVAGIFGSTSVEQSAVIYPVFFFAITVIAFFLLTRKIFIDHLGKKKANIIGLLSAFFLSVLPSFLPRTIAGIPEKESAAFFFMFMAFYFFLCSWKSKTKNKMLIFSVLSGLFTAGMALVWGGYQFIFLTLSLSLLIAFLFGQINKRKALLILVFILTSFMTMTIFSKRYNFVSLSTSVITGSIFLILLTYIVQLLITKFGIWTKIRRGVLKTVPKQFFSLVITSIISLIILTIMDLSFIPSTFSYLLDSLVSPNTSRLIQTVAENRQPYFSEWANNFGPNVGNFPIFFWLFFVGSIYLFLRMIYKFEKKDRIVLGFGYFIFLLSIIFSRLSQNHLLNGVNTISLLLYFTGTAIFVFILGFYYHKYHKENKEHLFQSIDFGLIMIMSFFVLGIIAARGAIRLVMMLVPPTSIIVSYFAVNLSYKFRKNRQNSEFKLLKLIFIGLILIGVLYSGYFFYKTTNSSAANYFPSAYNQQWQKAMSWVRENTNEDAVFAHWWDYGYWVQSIGERATVLDGGNAVSYWNHLMGRYALTSPNEMNALEFLYAHEVTHFLIDSSDIGKYTAFSSIGSNEEYDRRSWINTFNRDPSKTFETKNKTINIYLGGAILDEDIVYIKDDGERIFLPGVNDRELGGGSLAGIGGIKVEFSNDDQIEQPIGIYVYNGQQYELPLRYAYFNGEFIDFNKGAEAGIFVMPSLTRTSVDSIGSLIYLSNRVVKSQLARLYLYGEQNEYFVEVHSEDDFVIESLRSQGVDVGSFVYYNGFRGPIKIWEVDYPDDIELKEEFLETIYPESISVG